MSGDFSVALAGSVSAGISTLSVYPLDTVKTYLNKGSDEKGAVLRSVNDVLLKVVFIHGMNSKSFKALYSGVESKIVMSMAQKFIYFYIYSYLSRIVRKRYGQLSLYMNLLIGYTSALLAVGILTPFEIAQTIKQLDQYDNRSTLEIFRDTLAKEGVCGLYKGFKTNIFLCVHPAIDYTVFEQLKKYQIERKNRQALTDSEAFWLGAFSKAVATLLTFPHVRAKVLQQAGVKRYEKMGSTSILVNLFSTEGVTSWFAGMKTQLIKNVLSSAIMMASKERIERSVMHSLAKLS